MQRRICAQQAQCIPAATSACCCVEQSSRASPKRGTVLEPASPACQVRSRHRLGSSDRAPAPIGLPSVRTLRDSGLTWLIHALLLLLLLGCVDAFAGRRVLAHRQLRGRWLLLWLHYSSQSGSTEQRASVWQIEQRVDGASEPPPTGPAPPIAAHETAVRAAAIM